VRVGYSRVRPAALKPIRFVPLQLLPLLLNPTQNETSLTRSLAMFGQYGDRLYGKFKTNVKHLKWRVRNDCNPGNGSAITMQHFVVRADVDAAPNIWDTPSKISILLNAIAGCRLGLPQA
jgi:hypothetical protein